ncbi:hypothetical protein MtrunA17_Chr1g0186581 [Medicago truncatula]|uniref:Uncharacterized protein n=1 Tax=Medicago truncatula TaxID=3880 RepID=A0A396JSP4_MEDTR|nr:hypothetical protein MtrunA17_Chr1g0186581 [Medicago truncatula]
MQEIQDVKYFFDQQFNLGKLRFFLGLEIANSYTCIFVNQRNC